MPTPPLLGVLAAVMFVCMFSVSGAALSRSRNAERTICFYVSPIGSDNWSGTLAEPDSGKTDGPFASIVRARDAVRQLRKEQRVLKQPVTIFLRGGNYYLKEPVIFTPEDSGTRESPVVYTSYRNEKAVISGGQEISGWRLDRIGDTECWSADVPEAKTDTWYFTQLFRNGQRKQRTRLPKEGFFRVAEVLDLPPDTGWNRGQTFFRFAEGDLKDSWRNPGDVEIVSLNLWVESRMPIKSIDSKERIVHLAKPSTFWLKEDFGGSGVRYYVANVFEALDQPGEWYLDRSIGKLFYLPEKSETISESRFIAPKLSQLIIIAGNPTADKPAWVDYLQFINLNFCHTQWQGPLGQGGSVQAAYEVPAAIQFTGARNCKLEGCTIQNIGTYAVEVGANCQSVKVTANTMSDMGAGGVKITGGKNTTVLDNEIGDGGKIYHSAVGVLIQHSGYNKILHNHIHDLYYTGISVGWSWGYARSAAKYNIIEYNHIHHIGKGLLSDLGGIYTLGVSPGTRLRYNKIHDCQSYSYGGWGIYLDEGSTGVLVENNLVYRTKTGGFHQHYGKDNVVRNNIFAFAKTGQIQRTRVEGHRSFSFEGNIVYWTEGALLHGNWGGDGYYFDRNLYFNPNQVKPEFAGDTMEQWQSKGQDVHSIIADPGFVALDKDDFTLSAQSPALELGFKPFDLSAAGPRKKAVK